MLACRMPSRMTIVPFSPASVGKTWFARTASNANGRVLRLTTHWEKRNNITLVCIVCSKRCRLTLQYCYNNTTSQRSVDPTAHTEGYKATSQVIPPTGPSNMPSRSEQSTIRHVNDALERWIYEIFGVTPHGTLPSHAIPFHVFVVKWSHASDRRVLRPDFEVSRGKKINGLAQNNLRHKMDGTTLAPDTNVFTDRFFTP